VIVERTSLGRRNFSRDAMSQHCQRVTGFGDGKWLIRAKISSVGR